MDWLIYTVLSDTQRKKLSNFFSEEQKENIKKLVSGKRNRQKEKLQNIKYHLYSLGFREKGLEELKSFNSSTTDAFLKRLSAWEIALWYANQNTKHDAELALKYLPQAMEKEKNKDQLRRIAIVKAECYERIGLREKAREVINQLLGTQEHPDLFLAAANLENTIEERVVWINKVYQYYHLAPIEFFSENREVTYDDLKTSTMTRTIDDGPKVSVILPAYNAEDGIGTAIESILSQTWTNLELLVVDDCSTDNTKSVVRGYMEKDSRIKLYSTEQNSGPYVARNVALQNASGEFVTINDSDDWSHAEKIEIQVKHLINNKEVIANTSEHARLTEELTLYRRGTPGKYIFPNMSSIMFRRKPVMERLGFWDSVRFAADGEFKRRLIKEFGKNKYIDLKTGPLSLPRQSVTSLTGSSAFGYNGFFMGARREYVESLEFHHMRGETLYYPHPLKERLFPVPNPMLPNRTIGCNREFDYIIAADFRMDDMELINEITELKDRKMRIGLVQVNRYDLSLRKGIDIKYRSLIDGETIQMLVYGEKISSKVLNVFDPSILIYKQQYIPKIKAEIINVIINKYPSESEYYSLKKCKVRLKEYFNNSCRWYPLNSSIRQKLIDVYSNEINFINISDRNWKKD